MPKFYPIIDTSQVLLSRIDDITRTIIQAGARLIQLRGKDISTRKFVDTANIIRPIAKKNNAAFIINDRVDIAVLVGADGVHLGQGDLPIEEARRLLGDEKIIGISTHNEDEAKDAQTRGADYISFGPIFTTKTKKDAQEPKGILELKKIRTKVNSPIAAIGGITLENAQDVYRAGADSAAVISDILKSDDIKDRVKRFISL
ncbi:MAG: thiamine phosphate synthase [Deltaproteobacteria bacterium]|nr:thiamine phosphate synthase [Deltaproteobacteria bacterium]